MSDHSEKRARNKAVIDAFYQGGVKGDITTFESFLHPDFVMDAPNYLPWRGTRHGASQYLEILPDVAEALDFCRFSYVSFTAEDDHVVALISLRISGTDELIRISEHWNLKDGMAMSIWVAYYEPQTLLRQLGRPEAFLLSA